MNIETGFRVLAHLVAAMPLGVMSWQLFSNQIKGDPVQLLTHRTGWWALTFLLISLAMTPMRRWSKFAGFLRIRRMLGLWAFVFASLHLLIYVALDLRQEWARVFEDVIKRPYITVGFTAWMLLIPLALTSTQAMMRKLGRNWIKLHRLVYLIAPLAVLHFFWLVKKSISEPLIFAVILAILLGYRLLYRWQQNTAARD